MKLRRLTSLLLLAALPVFAQIKTSTPQPVIIDADVGDDIDDAFAVALALQTPSFHILGISTAYGDTTLRAHLFSRLFAETGHSNIPIAVGIPTQSKTSFTQAAYAKADTHPTPSLHAVDFLLSQAKQHPGQVTLIALGPLVNIGAAIDRDPEGFRKLKRVVVMGGSIHLGYNDGNDSKHPPAEPEWNILNDVASARKLLASGVPIYMMPLDSTQIALPTSLMQQIASQPDPLSKALTELHREYGKPGVLYDAVTVAYAVDSSFCPTTPMHIEISDKGLTYPSAGKPNVHVCLSSNATSFLKIFRTALLSKESATK